MIAGTVNARHEILIRLPVRNATGTEQEVEVTLDTGFNGSLTLPPALIAHLGFPWVTQGSAILANGAVEYFDVYGATVLWDGIARLLMVPAIDTAPLLGMAMLIGYDLRVRVALDFFNHCGP